MRPLLLAALAAPLLLAGCARTATVGTYDDDFGVYDADRDGFVSDSEFGVGFGDAGYYDDYDLDGDGRLDRNEFDAVGYGYDYDTFDADRDGFVSGDEYGRGVFGTFDTDRDGLLSDDEFGVGFGPYRGV